MPSISWSSPSPDIELLHVTYSNNLLLLTVKSTRTSASCPLCQNLASRKHSHYTRKVQDLPICDKSVELLLLTKRWFCDNPNCQVKIFTERYDWLLANGRRKKKFFGKLPFQLVAFQLRQ